MLLVYVGRNHSGCSYWPGWHYPGCGLKKKKKGPTKVDMNACDGLEILYMFDLVNQNGQAHNDAQ